MKDLENLKMFETYKTLVYREVHIEVDDAWYDDGVLYVETILEEFTDSDWVKLTKEIKYFNDATNIKVAESMADIYSIMSITILIKILTLMETTKLLEDVSAILYELSQVSTKIKIKSLMTQEEYKKIELLKSKSFILSKYLPKIIERNN